MIDANVKRETGQKAQLGNIQAAKVSVWVCYWHRAQIILPELFPIRVTLDSSSPSRPVCADVK